MADRERLELLRKKKRLAELRAKQQSSIDDPSGQTMGLSPFDTLTRGAKSTPILEMSAADKLFAKQYAKIAPIANVPLNESGETALSRLIDKVYAREGKYAGRDPFTGDIVIVNEATGEETAPPTFELGESAKRLGISAAGQILPTMLVPQVKGAQLLAQFGRGALRTAGAGIGAGSADVLNLRNAAVAAKNAGIISPEEESQVFSKEALATGLTSGFAGAAGQGVLGEALPTIGQALPKLGKKLRIEGNTGREISRSKGAIAAQSTIEDLQQSVAGVPSKETGEDSFGIAVKAIVNNTKDSLEAQTQELFSGFEKEVQDKILKGNVEFIDATKAYQGIIKLINQRKSAGVLPEDEAAKLINLVQRNLNGTRNDIGSGVLKVGKKTKGLFFPATDVTEQVATGQIDLVTGQPSFKAVTNQVIDEGFDPTKVTSLDLRRTINNIGLAYDDFGKAGQGVLANLRSTIRQATGDVYSTEAKQGIAEIADTLIVPPRELSKMRVAYAKAAEKYKVLPESLLNLETQANPSAYGAAAKTLSVEDAVKLKGLTNKADPAIQNQFVQGLKKDILTETRGVAKAGPQTVDTSKLTPEMIREAKLTSSKEGAEQFLQEGGQLDFGKLKGAVKDPVKQTISSEETISGKNIRDHLRFNPQQKILLGNEGQLLEKTGQQLQEFQSQAGLQANLPELVAAQKGAETAQQTLDKLLPAGGFASKILSGIANPAYRLGADVLESAPVSAATQFAASPLGQGLSRGLGVGIPALLANTEDVENLFKKATFTNSPGARLIGR